MSLAEIYRDIALVSFGLSAILFLICIFLLTKGGAYKTIKEFLYKKNILKIDIQDDSYDIENAVLEDEEGVLLKSRDQSEATSLMKQNEKQIPEPGNSAGTEETVTLCEYAESDETLPLEEIFEKSEEHTAMLYDDGTDETMPLSINITNNSEAEERRKKKDQKKEVVPDQYENGTQILEHKIFFESKEI